MFPTIFSWTVWRIWGVGPWSTVDPSLEQDDIQLDQSGRGALKWYFNTVDQLLQQSWKDLEGIKLKLRWGESTRVFCRFHFLKQSRAWQDLPIWGKRGQKQKQTFIISSHYIGEKGKLDSKYNSAHLRLNNKRNKNELRKECWIEVTIMICLQKTYGLYGKIHCLVDIGQLTSS